MKTCSTCKISKFEEDFNKRTLKKSVILQASCKSCNAAYNKKHYEVNKKSYIEGNKARINRTKKLLFEYKAKTPCMDCGGRYPHFCMDFDHRDPETKLFNVSVLAHRGGKQKLLDEMAKCDLVCANCHRIRTFSTL